MRVAGASPAMTVNSVLPNEGRFRFAMIILIDNYDSFTFNLVHYFGALGAEVVVHRNDKVAQRSRAGRRSGRDRAVARAVHAERGRHLPRPDRQGRGRDPDLRRLPRPSGDRRGLRRRRRARAAAGARQALGDRTTAAPACFAASTGRSGRRATIRSWSSARRMPEDLLVTAETDDGLVMGLSHARLSGARRAVPSRKHRLRARAPDPEEFPRPGGAVERQEGRRPPQRRPH